MPRPSKSESTAPAGPRLVKGREPSSSLSPEVTHEQIAKRAYEIFVQNDCLHGHHIEHWLRAEQELKSVPAVPRPKRAAAPRARS
jgi:Protein of unknown function (DUF2934)